MKLNFQRHHPHPKQKIKLNECIFYEYSLYYLQFYHQLEHAYYTMMLEKVFLPLLDMGSGEV